MKLLRLTLYLLACFLLGGLASGCATEQAHESPEAVMTRATGLADDSKQALLVLGEGESRFVRAWLLERESPATAWRIEMGPMAGVIGARGFAPPSEKREGDRRSPTGAFTITETFGVAASLATRMPYRELGPREAVCEDPSSLDYNRWIVLPADAPNLTERDRWMFQHAAFIDYNRAPVVPGAGSAIWLHVADVSPLSAGTLGCVGLSPDDVKRVLLRLDPAARPLVLMGRTSDLVGEP